MEEMRKNVVAAQQKNFEAEQSLCNALRAHTKNMNLEKDLEDTHSTAWRVGGNEEDKTRRPWAQDEGVEQKSPQP